MRLIACPHCARHVRHDGVVCPFCAGALPPPSNARARVSAMLVGAATVSSLAGCPRHATKYGGPPPPPEQPRAAEPELVEPDAIAGDADAVDPDAVDPDAAPTESPDGGQAVEPQSP